MIYGVTSGACGACLARDALVESENEIAFSGLLEKARDFATADEHLFVLRQGLDSDECRGDAAQGLLLGRLVGLTLSRGFITAEQRGSGKCSSFGDPHMVTFDGTRYSPHVFGDFFLMDSPEFTVQVRHLDCSIASNAQSRPKYHAAMCNRAFAFKAEDETMSFEYEPSTKMLNFSIDGEAKKPQRRMTTSAGTTISMEKYSYSEGFEIGIQWKRGHSALIKFKGTNVYNIDLKPSPAIGATYGLCGTWDRCACNDFVYRGKTNGTGNVYKVEFVESWRVDPRESLFLEPQKMYVDGKVEGALPSTAGRSSTEAEMACSELKRGTPEYDACVFDVIESGDVGIAESSILAVKSQCAELCALGLGLEEGAVDCSTVCSQSMNWARSAVKKFDMYATYDKHNPPPYNLGKISETSALFSAPVLAGRYTLRGSVREEAGCDLSRRCDPEEVVTVNVGCNTGPVTLQFEPEGGSVVKRDDTWFGFPPHEVKLKVSRVGGNVNSPPPAVSWRLKTSTENHTNFPDIVWETTIPPAESAQSWSINTLVATSIAKIQPISFGLFILEASVYDGCQVIHAETTIKAVCGTVCENDETNNGSKETAAMDSTALSAEPPYLEWNSNIGLFEPTELKLRLCFLPWSLNLNKAEPPSLGRPDGTCKDNLPASSEQRPLVQYLWDVEATLVAERQPVFAHGVSISGIWRDLLTGIDDGEEISSDVTDGAEKKTRSESTMYFNRSGIAFPNNAPFQVAEKVISTQITRQVVTHSKIRTKRYSGISRSSKCRFRMSELQQNDGVDTDYVGAVFELSEGAGCEGEFRITLTVLDLECGKNFSASTSVKSACWTPTPSLGSCSVDTEISYDYDLQRFSNAVQLNPFEGSSQGNNVLASVIVVNLDDGTNETISPADRGFPLDWFPPKGGSYVLQSVANNGCKQGVSAEHAVVASCAPKIDSLGKVGYVDDISARNIVGNDIIGYSNNGQPVHLDSDPPELYEVNVAPKFAAEQKSKVYHVTSTLVNHDDVEFFRFAEAFVGVSGFFDVEHLTTSPLSSNSFGVDKATYDQLSDNTHYFALKRSGTYNIVVAEDDGCQISRFSRLQTLKCRNQDDINDILNGGLIVELRTSQLDFGNRLVCKMTRQKLQTICSCSIEYKSLTFLRPRVFGLAGLTC